MLVTVDTISAMIDFDILDPEAPTAENVDAVLSYLREKAEGVAFEHKQAARLCERHRSRILRGDPPLGVLRAVERGVAPLWVVDTLRRRLVVDGSALTLAAA